MVKESLQCSLQRLRLVSSSRSKSKSLDTIAQSLNGQSGQVRRHLDTKTQSKETASMACLGAHWQTNSSSHSTPSSPPLHHCIGRRPCRLDCTTLCKSFWRLNVLENWREASCNLIQLSTSQPVPVRIAFTFTFRLSYVNKMKLSLKITRKYVLLSLLI